MPRNVDGEFELVLGNRQLLSVFFIVVVLLGVFFTMGYIVGRNSAPVVAEVQRKSEPAASLDSAPPSEPAPAIPAKDDSAPTHTAQQLPADSSTEPAAESKPVPEAKAESKPDTKPEIKKAAKSEPEASKTEKGDAEAARIKAEEAKRARATSGDQPAPGQAYLQLAATSKHEADVMVDVLRQKGFKALAAEIGEKPGTFRVLVGPVADGTTNGVRADLQKSGFPGNAAIRRTF